VWETFKAWQLDLDRTRRNYLDQLNEQVGKAAKLLTQAQRQVAELTEQRERVTGDYRAGTIPAETATELLADIAEELSAAEAEEEGLRRREAEVRQAAEEGVEDDFVAALGHVEEVVAHRVADAEVMGLQRDAIRRSFDRFVYDGEGRIRAFYRGDFAEQIGVRLPAAKVPRTGTRSPPRRPAPRASPSSSRRPQRPTASRTRSTRSPRSRPRPT
jgi:hypothetical protein